MEYVTALATRNLTKSFPGVRALHRVDFDVRGGEVHVLLGENGAGKSTLVKVLTGVHQPDSGECIIDGTPVTIGSPIASFHLGIAAIYQELSLLPHLDVATNIYLGKLPLRHWVIDKSKLYEDARKVLESLQSDVDPRAQVASLGFGRRQLVEIAKALASKARFLFMDEPTSALDNDDREHLFRIIQELRANGLSIIYISHKLEEVNRVGDRVTVLRDGERVFTGDVAGLTVEELIHHMVGRGLKQKILKEEQLSAATGTSQREVMLEVRHLNRSGLLHDISFSLHKGEILGFAGLVGAGRTEMVNCIFGVDPFDSGEVLVGGVPVRIRSPRDAIRHGIAMITEDRKNTGILGMMSITDNVTIPLINSAIGDNCVRFGVLQTAAQARVSASYVDKLAVRTPSVRQLVNNLSGGNQQKVILAKWLALRSKILIFDEPTRGIDVGAKDEIYLLIDELLKQGISIIMISSELPELLALSDRIIVLSGGRISGEFRRNETNQEGIMACAVRYT